MQSLCVRNELRSKGVALARARMKLLRSRLGNYFPLGLKKKGGPFLAKQNTSPIVLAVATPSLAGRSEVMVLHNFLSKGIKMTQNTSIQALAKQITSSIVDDLKKGVAPWVRPWVGGQCSPLPVNGKTGKYYNGINWLNLLLVAQARGYDSNEWFTFKQAVEQGGLVKKGSKGSKVLFCTPVEKEGEAGEETEIYMATKIFTVFAREQIEGLPLPETYPNVTTAEVEHFINTIKADIRRGGGKAYFAPFGDYIQIPELKHFKSSQDYYATLMHELIHWTGHASRLNRDCSNYAFEELVAELGAAFLCAKLGIEGKLQHAEYINHWIESLNNDYRFITQAASKAQKAVHFLLG